MVKILCGFKPLPMVVLVKRLKKDQKLSFYLNLSNEKPNHGQFDLKFEGNGFEVTEEYLNQKGIVNLKCAMVLIEGPIRNMLEISVKYSCTFNFIFKKISKIFFNFFFRPKNEFQKI